MPVLIGLDIGTSGAKAAAFDEQGKTLCEASASYPCYRPRPGWAEHDPNDWWKTACEVLSGLCEQIDPSDVAAVGVDGISWTAVPVDRNGEALSKAPIWMDTRAVRECDRLVDSYGSEMLLQLSGNPVEPGFSLPKVMWLREHYPDLNTKTACWLESNSFVVSKLTGKFSIDPTQGFGWACYDIRHNSWDEELCEDLGLTDKLPPVYKTHEVVGKVTAGAASLTGLKEGTPVIAGGMDTSCGCFAAGVVRFGQTQEQGGQSGGVAVYEKRYHPDSRLMIARHVIPEGYLYCGATVGGSSSYAWFEREFGQPERSNGMPDFNALNKLAATVPAGSEGLIFLPYMNGERTPIFDPGAKGMYFGLDFTKTRAHLARATMEGVAFSVRHAMETAAEVGAPAGELLSVGGAAKSPLWMQIKSDVTGKRIVVKRADVGSALGVAMVAGVGVGLYRSFENAVSACDSVRAEYEPDPERHEMYSRMFEIYKKLYTHTRALMHELPAASEPVSL